MTSFVNDWIGMAPLIWARIVLMHSACITASPYGRKLGDILLSVSHLKVNIDIEETFICVSYKYDGDT
jgi:hypothetical protein